MTDSYRPPGGDPPAAGATCGDSMEGSPAGADPPGGNALQAGAPEETCGAEGELHLPGGTPGSSASRGMVRLLSGDFVGIEGRCVEVQVDVAACGCPAFDVVGLAGKSIRESRQRIRAAFRNSGLRFPWNHRILVNLAPSAEEKDGAGFDLAIAVGILVASGHVPIPAEATLRGAGFLGELGLDGKVLPVPGALLTADALRERGIRRMIVAPGNAAEVSLVRGISVFAAADIHRAISALRGGLPPHERQEGTGIETASAGSDDLPDLAEVRGQDATKRAILISAAGGHNLLMTGPPGVGKTMLARRLPGILPPLESAEALEVTRILSVMGQPVGDRLAAIRPFRAPHHTISYAGLVGGGARIQPGEVTRAHRGVLFLDELPEFQRRTLEALREPLEEGVITITRGSGSRTFPARFLLVAAMNPCPCGYLGHPQRACACTPVEVRSYRQRVSGPLLDRMDIFVQVSVVRAADLLSASRSRREEDSRALRERVLAARDLQARRWGRAVWNSRVTLPRLLAEGDIRAPALEKLRGAADRWGMSARGFARCLRVARTVADLDGERFVDVRHLGEAIHFRQPQ